jgi:quinoprotein glucose dehydrogenase
MQLARRALAASGLLVGLGLLLACDPSGPVDYRGPLAEWRHFGGDSGGLSYSPLNQITAQNVKQLELAWTYRHGDYSDGSGDYSRTSFQATPIAIGDSLYFCTAFNRVISLDAETGEERWVFDPELRAKRGEGPYPLTCRGVAYWESQPDAEEVCGRRIFTGTRDSELIALDAATGQPCADFGVAGRVDLRAGIGEAASWEYYPTSPPLVVRDRVVMGALVADNVRADAPSGVVRAFDARTGVLRWAWDPVPPDWPEHSPVHGPYQRGTPNAWAPMAADEERGLVFVPTGNASPDIFGGARGGLDHYASSTVALDATSGEVAWHFQSVHHDIWDYDVATQPSLFEIPGVGGGAPALAQATKMGHVFLLNRETGEPLYPVEERPVPQGGVEGETLSPTQPFPTHPPPLHPTSLGVADAWGFTPIDRRGCAERIAALRSEGIFTPPSLQGSVQFPGSAGGMNWGGIAIDPVAGILYANQLHTALVTTLVPRAEYAAMDPSEIVYPEEAYPQDGTPYGVKRYALLSDWGAPCNPPPWGSLSAVDLRSGELLWKVTLGSTRDMAPFPLWLPLGAPNLGGSVVTAGGVLFIAATTEKFFRAFDAGTGEELWRVRIPFTGNSKPMTYRVRKDGRQFVVLAAGGHGWSEPGDAVVAYALP